MTNHLPCRESHWAIRDRPDGVSVILTFKDDRGVPYVIELPRLAPHEAAAIAAALTQAAADAVE